MTAKSPGSWIAGEAARRPERNLIATCRRREAGGRIAGRSPSSFFISPRRFARAAPGTTLKSRRVQQCPPELARRAAGRGATAGSAHFFERMPRDLAARRCGTAAGHGPDAIKIAAQCDSLAEACKLLRFRADAAEHRGHPHGRRRAAGAHSRLARRSAFTYAPVEHATAPGQISLDEIEAPLPRRPDRPPHARLRRDRRSHRPFAFAGHAERGISGAPNERGVFAVSGARSARISSTPSGRSEFAVSA